MSSPDTGRRDPKGRWSLGRAFVFGALFGAAFGVFWGWIDYGALEIGYLSNHVLGALFPL